MRNLLLTLSSISTLTFSWNSVLNSTFIQHRNALKPSSNATNPITSTSSLFNNEYEKLNDSDWITNQSTTDNKYYSYDTSHANYELSDKTNVRNAFMVDDNGQLVIKTKKSYTKIDHNNLNNTKDEIIAHRKVTTINRVCDNAYIGSEFCNDIFTGDNSDWKFLQESQVEKHVDISDVTCSNKVLYNDNLSEGLGLYYIGQAAKYQSKTEWDVYIQLARTFMNRSILGTNVPDEILAGIINTFIRSSNNVALQYLSGVPFQNTGGDTNYATNYILDSHNQVVEIYYNQYTKQYNIKNLNLQFGPQVISVKNPEAKAVKDIESLIKQKILNSFKNKLNDKLKIKPAQIDDKFFTLKFNNENAAENFNTTTPIAVSYTITTDWQAANQFNFAGTFDGTIPVINKCVNLSDENNLKTTIENKYNNTEPANWLTVNTNNKNHDNADSSLTDECLKSANDQIINTIKTDVVNYFQTNDSDIGIKNNDFIITTNLQKGDNLFNQQQGKNFSVAITALTRQYRISDSLSSINIIVHYRNTDFINATNRSDSSSKFSLDGIHQLDHEDTNVLQDGNHKYDQPKLLARLVGDPENRNSQISKDSALGTIESQSYGVDGSIFTRNIDISFLLEDATSYTTVSLPIDSKTIIASGGSASNFWDVLFNTQMIWLQTIVVHSDNDRTLNVVSLVFAPSTNPDDKPLCVFDLSNQFAGKSISNPAALSFPDFQFVINYQQMS